MNERSVRTAAKAAEKAAETTFSGAPAWFDARRHRLTDIGIVRLMDGALLAADGRPASGALRAAEERAEKDRAKKDRGGDANANRQ